MLASECGRDGGLRVPMIGSGDDLRVNAWVTHDVGPTRNYCAGAVFSTIIDEARAFSSTRIGDISDGDDFNFGVIKKRAMKFTRTHTKSNDAELEAFVRASGTASRS